MFQPIILLLGYGPNIGHAVPSRFTTEGYKVAIASRSLEDETFNEAGWLQLRVDLASPETVPAVFSKVIKHFGIPSVVNYNGRGRPSQSLFPGTD
jgi:NAD(P)-dependent dehydrogenase (short-subunit alcohol dehydrogenase family)